MSKKKEAFEALPEREQQIIKFETKNESGCDCLGRKLNVGDVVVCNETIKGRKPIMVTGIIRKITDKRLRIGIMGSELDSYAYDPNNGDTRINYPTEKIITIESQYVCKIDKNVVDEIIK